MADKRPIGIFDSGVGGLTVVSEIIKRLPSEDIIYFGDTKRVPYGTKSNETIKKFAMQDASFLLSKGVKMIVAACGTVSSVAQNLKYELSVPFVGVVSNAAKAAVKATVNKKIGAIGTDATIRSHAYENEILKIMPDAQIFTNACPMFVPMVENGLTSSDDVAVKRIAEEYLMPLKRENIDTLILGCTHYPLLSDVIKNIMGDKVTLINMGEATSEFIFSALKEGDILNTSEKSGECNIYVSDLTQSFCETASFILQSKISQENVFEFDIEGLK